MEEGEAEGGALAVPEVMVMVGKQPTKPDPGRKGVEEMVVVTRNKMSNRGAIGRAGRRTAGELW